MAEITALRKIAKAIENLDSTSNSVFTFGTASNVIRKKEARRLCINILFSSGYGLEMGTYKLIKLNKKQTLVKK